MCSVTTPPLVCAKFGCCNCLCPATTRHKRSQDCCPVIPQFSDRWMRGVCMGGWVRSTHRDSRFQAAYFMCVGRGMCTRQLYVGISLRPDIILSLMHSTMLVVCGYGCWCRLGGGCGDGGGRLCVFAFEGVTPVRRVAGWGDAARPPSCPSGAGSPVPTHCASGTLEWIWKWQQQ